MRGDGGPGEWALVTGASAGIGREIARALARRGWKVLLAARRKDRLEAVAQELRREMGVSARALPVDLRDPGAIDRLVARLEGEGIEVEILVNSAGAGIHAPFLETDLERLDEVLEVNAAAVTRLIRRFLPSMVRRGRGRILNVASIAAFQPGPRMAVYYASKAYVLSLSEALREEVRGSGVTVTALCPGPTRSGFHASAGIRSGRLARRFADDPEAVAEYGVRAVLAGKGIAVPRLWLRAYLLGLRFLPRAWVPSLVRMVQDRRG